jgi:hypothetical protein
MDTQIIKQSFRDVRADCDFQRERICNLVRVLQVALPIKTQSKKVKIQTRTGMVEMSVKDALIYIDP